MVDQVMTQDCCFVILMALINQLISFVEFLVHVGFDVLAAVNFLRGSPFLDEGTQLLVCTRVAESSCVCK